MTHPSPSKAINAPGASPWEWDHFDLILGLAEDLLPVVAREGVISPDSKIAHWGKTPSEYNRRGQIRGILAWPQMHATNAQIEHWRNQGDYGICVQTRTVRGLDVDITDAVLAQEVQAFIAQTLGLKLPRRHRTNSSKFLHPFALKGQYGKRVIHVGDHEKIEFLMNGQQFVAVGTHPSGARIEWDGGLPVQIPEIAPAQFETLFEALQERFGIKPASTSSSGTRLKGQHLAIEDRAVAYLQTHEMILGERDGGLMVECPWSQEHTMGEAGDGTTIYYPAGANGISSPGFKCLHGHCEHRKFVDFYQAIGYQNDSADEFEDLSSLIVGSEDQAVHQKSLRPSRQDILDLIDSGDLVGLEPKELITTVVAELVKARLDNIDEEAVLNSLKANASCTLGALRKDLTLAKRKGLEHGQQRVSTDYPVTTAKALVVQCYTVEAEITIRRWQEEFLEWDGMCYRIVSTEDVRAKVYKLFEKQGVELNGRVPVDNTLDALKAVVNVPSSLTMPGWLKGDPPQPVKDLIAVRNGLLHVRSQSLFEHSPRFFSTGSVNVRYERDAPTPVHWLKFLQEAFVDDKETIDALQEWFGYLLTQDTSQQKGLICVGPKRCGKGTIARVLRAVLGEHNCTGPSLAHLSSPFGLEDLIGKSLALISDARVSKSADLQSISENLLRITGEDAISVARKHKSDWVGKLNTRFVLLTNLLPGIVDAGGAVGSRFIVLQFTQSFFGREDIGLTDKLMTELPSILNWALDGLQALLARGVFTQPASGQAAVQEFIRKTTPILGFIGDSLIYDAQAWVSKSVLYEAYQQWCVQEGMKFTNQKNSFFGEIYANCDGRLLPYEPRGDDGKRLKLIRGARFVPGVAERSGTFERNFAGVIGQISTNEDDCADLV